MKPLGRVNLFCPICGFNFKYNGSNAGQNTMHHKEFGVVCSKLCFEAAELKYAMMVMGKDSEP